MNEKILLGIAAWLLCIGIAHAQLYKWVDKDGRVHYTDKPPPGTKAQVIVPAREKPSAAPVQPHDKSRTQATFSPEEREALSVLCGIQALQTKSCRPLVGRLCTFGELVGGIPGRPSRGLARDPRNNPSYEFKLGARRDSYVAAAEPRRGGLSGFLATRDATHYNTRGAATTKDAKVQGGVTCADAVKQ